MSVNKICLLLRNKTVHDFQASGRKKAEKVLKRTTTMPFYTYKDQEV